MRVDRILSLENAASYPRCKWLDLVIFLGCLREQTVRLWLLTAAAAPIVRINELEFFPDEREGRGERGLRWLDLGVTDGLKARFGQLRIGGMSVAEARSSRLLITRDLEFVPTGELDAVETAIFGISRRNAGRTTIIPSRLEVGTPVTFEAIYTAGPHGLPAGARVRFAVPRAFSRPQIEDAKAPGFVSVHADTGGPANREADGAAVLDGQGQQASVEIISLDVSEESHEQVDIICRLPRGLEPGGRIYVSYRTEQMYIFPWQRHLVERPLWFAHLAPLAAAVALDERDLWVELLPEHSHSFETVAGPAERLHLFLPGRVHEGEEVFLRGVFTDRFRNTPSPRSVPRDVRLRILDEDGERDLARPRGAFEAPHRFRISLGRLEEGLYRVRAYDARTDELLAHSNPLQVLDDDSDDLNVYWGEIHGHTEMSDGIGGYEEMFRIARDEGCQDFAAATDHACYFTDNEWEWMQDVANAYNERGGFVTLLGYEWAGRQGHRCIYARGRRLPLFRGMYEPQSNLDVIYREFRDAESVVAGPHHTGANGSMEHHDPTIERFIEVYSMWGASDRSGAPKAPLFPGANPLPVHEWLNAGAKLGFTGGGDCHEGRSGWSPDDPNGQGSALHGFARILRYRCGLTAALMPELRRRELIEALRERRTWATTGARILLEFTVSGIEMGQEGKAKRAEVEAEIHAVTELARLEIIRDGEVVQAVAVGGLDAEIEWRDPEPVGERTWYYLHVIQRDGEEAWSSPVWLCRR